MRTRSLPVDTRRTCGMGVTLGLRSRSRILDENRGCICVPRGACRCADDPARRSNPRGDGLDHLVCDIRTALAAVSAVALNPAESFSLQVTSSRFAMDPPPCFEHASPNRALGTVLAALPNPDLHHRRDLVANARQILGCVDVAQPRFDVAGVCHPLSGE